MTGRVIDGTGTPLRDALVEIWQADANGLYNSPMSRAARPIRISPAGAAAPPMATPASSCSTPSSRAACLPGRPPDGPAHQLLDRGARHQYRPARPACISPTRPSQCRGPDADAHRASRARADADRHEAQGRFVHFGATSQDIIDTSLALRLQGILGLFDTALRIAGRHLRARRPFRREPLMGRTRMQDALPITAGDRLAVWRGLVERAHARSPRVRCGPASWSQLGGPVGTLGRSAAIGASR
jgi:hypothetical protein